jgi:glutathionylspermidine synthase
MERRRIEPRHDWQRTVESLGFDWHTSEGERYWIEDAYYAFSLAQIEGDIEAATGDLEAMCRALIGEIIDRQEVYDRLSIPAYARDRIAASWRIGEPSLYGRFDLAYDGKGPPKLLEFNADTPTSLFEAAVIQWYWLEDQKSLGRLPAKADQFNSLHEKLIARWKLMPPSNLVHFAAMQESPEDWRTIDYLADVAKQSGRQFKLIDVPDIGLDGARFCDRDREEIRLLFKLYPWEWMFADSFGSSPAMAMTRFIEPAWKCLLSNKGLLPLLWDFAPGHPNLLPAFFETDDRKATIGARFAKKPIWSREGANVLLVDGEDVVGHTTGTYGVEGYIRQALVDLPVFDGMHPVIGSWLVGDQPAGMGIREDASRVTGNRSRFVPHVIL